MKHDFFISILVLKMAWNVFKNSRLDNFLVHLAGQSMKGEFTPEAIARLIGMKPHRVYKILNGSNFFLRTGKTFTKRERLSSIYAEGLIQVIDGKVKVVEHVDFRTLDAPIKEPLIGYFMEVVKKYGDGMSLFEMAILLAVYEGCTTMQAIIDRVDFDRDTTTQAVEQLLIKKLLAKQIRDDETHYSFTSQSSDIFGMIFKAKDRARSAKA